MKEYLPYLSWLDRQYLRMCELVAAWADVNSWSHNVPGLDKLLSLVEREFEVLGGTMERVELPCRELADSHGNLGSQPLGKALRVRKRTSAQLRVLLCCHIDTVYPPDQPFRQTVGVDKNTLSGPGVTDAKGGLVVMLKALEALENSLWAERIGWDVIINPDEEIGSPGSALLLESAARNTHLGLVFEPCFSDGALVGSRKGSGNFSVIARGKAAHAGREPHLGRNAINALAQFIVALNAFASSERGIAVNVGSISGGGPVNVVPDLAQCRFNVRVDTAQDQVVLEEYLARVTEGEKQGHGTSLERYGSFSRPPKPLDWTTLGLLQGVSECGRDLGLSIEWRPSGGACDGNNLAAAGLPTVDSLGVRGGEIHSPREYLVLDSLLERAKLTALFLMKLAAGDIIIPRR